MAASGEAIFLLLYFINLVGVEADNNTLAMDKANVTFHNSLDYNISILRKSDECWGCPFVLVANMPALEQYNMKADSQFSMTLEIHPDHNTSVKLCSDMKNITNPWFGEYGNYDIYIYYMSGDSDKETDCRLILSVEPVNSYLPILVAFCVFFVMALLWIFIKYCHRKNLINRILFCMETDRLVNSVGNNSYLVQSVSRDLGTPTHTGLSDGNKTTRTRERLKSLDTFRGLCLMIMIFVNYGGGQYWFFHHSYWNGLTVADLVFPWFVFIMGTAMALSMASLRRKEFPRTSLFLKIFRRTIILFILGLIISNGNGNDWAKLRIPGVLQRFSISYFAVAMLELFFAQGSDKHQFAWWAPVRDVLVYWQEWLIMSAVVALWTCITFLFKFENCPAGYLGPGGIHDNHSYENCTGGAAGYIDRWLLSDNHIYKKPTCSQMYETTMAYDPEGILGSLTSIFMCFLGLQAGKILVVHKSWVSRVVRWLIWAVILGAVSGVLCKFSQNDGWIPVNKNLWSLTFVTTLASFAFVLLAICYLIIDVYPLWTGAPFFYPGMNSIFVYCGSEILGGYIPISWKVANNHPAQLAMDLWGATFWILVSVYLYWKGVFISV